MVVTIMLNIDPHVKKELKELEPLSKTKILTLNL